MRMRLNILAVLVLLPSLPLPLHAQHLEWTGYSNPKVALCVAARGATIFAGTHLYQGLFRSKDNGLTWKHLDSGMARYRVEDVNSIAIDGDHIYAGSELGIFRSTDNGNVWEFADSLGHQRVTAVLVKDTMIFAGGSGYIFRSSNHGASWKQLDKPANCFAVDGSTIYAGSGYADFGLGFFHSTDNGNSWSSVNGGLSFGSGWNVYSMAVVGNTVFAAIKMGNSPGGYEVYRSIDSGRTWTATHQSSQIQSLAVIGATLFASGTSLFHSTDLGTTWLAGSVYGANIVASGTSLYATCFNNIESSTDEGKTWVQSGNGWPRPGVVPNIRSVAANGALVFASIDDSVGSTYRSVDDGASWQRVLSNSGIIAFAGSDVYVGSARSTDNGDTWTAGGSLPSTFTIDALCNIGTTLFAASAGGVYRSIDHAVTWTHVSNFHVPDAFCFAVRGTMLFAGTNDGVYRSSNLGDSWIWVDSNRPSSRISAMTVQGSTLFAGWNRSRDDGDTWQPLDIKISGPPTLVSNAGTVYAGTSDGVYTTTNAGVTWISQSSGLRLGGATVNGLAVSRGAVYAAGKFDLFRADAINNLSVIYRTDRVVAQSAIQIFPNPVSSTSIVQYSLDSPAEVSLSIIDALGCTVNRPVIREMQNAGRHEVTLDARKLHAGSYMVCFRAGDKSYVTEIAIDR